MSTEMALASSVRTVATSSVEACSPATNGNAVSVPLAGASMVACSRARAAFVRANCASSTETSACATVVCVRAPEALPVLPPV